MTDETDQNLREHLEALERGGYPVLSLERALDSFDGDDEELGALRRAAREFLDAEREAGHGVAATVVEALAGMRSLEPGAAIQFLGVARAGLGAGRKAAIAVSGLGRTIARLGDEAAVVAENLVRLAELDGKHGTEGLKALAEGVPEIPIGAMRPLVKGLPALYQRDAELGEAACQALAAAGKRGGENLVRAVAGLLEVEPEADAEFMPDLALALAKNLHKVDEALLKSYVAALVPAAKSSAGSAEDLARRLPAAVTRLEEGLRQPYLERVAALTEAIGPGVIGFSVKALLALYSKRGKELTDRFLDTALKLAAEHGRWAGQTFLLGETDAARTFLR